MLKRNQIIETMYDEKAVIGTKEDLINEVVSLNIGHSFDWWDISGDDVGIVYCIEKMKWQDSLIVLIGGYGGEIMCASLDDEYNEEVIKRVVNDFFELRYIHDDELIAIHKVCK